MNFFDIVILSAVVLITVGIIVYLVRLKKKGKSICGGNCSKCSACRYKDN